MQSEKASPSSSFAALRHHCRGSNCAQVHVHWPASSDSAEGEGAAAEEPWLPRADSALVFAIGQHI